MVIKLYNKNMNGKNYPSPIALYPGQVVSKRYKQARLRRNEYIKLKKVVPLISNKRFVSKLEIIEETSRYIDDLENQVIAKLNAIRDLHDTNNTPMTNKYPINNINQNSFTNLFSNSFGYFNKSTTYENYIRERNSHDLFQNKFPYLKTINKKTDFLPNTDLKEKNMLNNTHENIQINCQNKILNKTYKNIQLNCEKKFSHTSDINSQLNCGRKLPTFTNNNNFQTLSQLLNILNRSNKNNSNTFRNTTPEDSLLSSSVSNYREFENNWDLFQNPNSSLQSIFLNCSNEDNKTLSTSIKPTIVNISDHRSNMETNLNASSNLFIDMNNNNNNRNNNYNVANLIDINNNIINNNYKVPNSIDMNNNNNNNNTVANLIELNNNNNNYIMPNLNYNKSEFQIVNE